jgi:TRAP-type C4-dicarboxylate transport system permease small subunit
MLRAIKTSIYLLSTKLNWVSAASVIFIMLLTCADVVMRLFGSPIPGTYELVGYFGSVIISFGIARTSIERGHIAVNLLVDRLPQRAQTLIEGVGNIAAAVLFGALAWQSQLYARDLLETGDVSLTLGMPTWPFVLGLATGSGMLSLVLFLDALWQLKRGLKL